MSNRGLRLPLTDGRFTSLSEPYADEHYVVHRAHPSFQFFWHASLSVCAMSQAVASLSGHSVSSGDHVALAGYGLDYTVRVPAFGSVHAVMARESIPGLVFSVHWHKLNDAQQGWQPEFKVWLEHIFWPVFVHLYETNRAKIGKHGGEVGRLAQIIRDSYAHGGVITNRKSGAEASWEGISIRKDDNGRPISDFIGGSDLLIVALKLASITAK